MSQADADTWVLHRVVDAEQVQRLYPLMAQLRPHLTSAHELVERWQRQHTQGYELLAWYKNGQAQALAGFRVQENLLHGRFLYIDDLVTDAKARSQGHGAQLMAQLKALAREQNCTRLVLDTPLSNALGHRFYFRCGLLATSLRFGLPIHVSV